eukprot:1148091-Pelagomonas_calceolata.AAC.1
MNTIDKLKKTGLDHQRASKVAHELHSHSIKHAHKLATARRAFENNGFLHSQVLEPGASSNSPDPTSPSLFCSVVDGTFLFPVTCGGDLRLLP